jgi:hypothetical protein
MKNVNEKVAELVKGNKAIENYLEVSALEKANEEKLNKLMAQIKTSNDRLIDSWVKSGKFALAVEKVLNKMMKDLKAEGLSITMKQLVPLAVGGYQGFRRNVQIGNLTEKQVEAFRTAVHKDSTIAVQKTSILDFAKGVKKTKSKPKSKPTNAGGGKEQIKEGGKDTPKTEVVGLFELKGIKVELIKDENEFRSVNLNGSSLKDVAKAFKLFQTQIEMLNEARVKK